MLVLFWIFLFFACSAAMGVGADYGGLAGSLRSVFWTALGSMILFYKVLNRYEDQIAKPLLSVLTALSFVIGIVMFHNHESGPWSAAYVSTGIVGLIITALHLVSDARERLEAARQEAEARQQREHREMVLATRSQSSWEVVLGDSFKDITNSTVVNRSNLEHSFNVAQGNDPELARTLTLVAAAIGNSGNQEARELFEQFRQELSSSQPKKSVLKACWHGIQSALPAVTAIAEATTTIAKLF